VYTGGIFPSTAGVSEQWRHFSNKQTHCKF